MQTKTSAFVFVHQRRKSNLLLLLRFVRLIYRIIKFDKYTTSLVSKVSILTGRINSLEIERGRLIDENNKLKQQLNNQKTLNRNLSQIVEALGDNNRYFAGESLGHAPNDDEATAHFIKNGGKENFDKKHPL